MIRQCDNRDFDTIYAIVNDAAMAYKGVIPADRWHDPYMPKHELRAAIDSGIEFWGFELDGVLVGVMGIQPVQDVTLIRHAYVLTSHRRHGIGGQLLRFLLARTGTPTLIGTWAAADWAIRFYEKYGFRLVTPAEKDRLLPKYWGVPHRQIETSVVLGDERWFDAALTIWIWRYFPAEQIPEVKAVMDQYGSETWHREPYRVKRDAVIVSRGSIDALQAAIKLAMIDYRDVLIGEEVDPWMMGELRKYGG
jgi:GNAT superfamily N-acetyltransferase